jgi:hypothetical protein
MKTCSELSSLCDYSLQKASVESNWIQEFWMPIEQFVLLFGIVVLKL